MADYKQPGNGRFYKVEAENTLLNFLYETLEGQSKTSIKAYLEKGQVAINGRVSTFYNQQLKKGDTVNILPKAVSLHNQTLRNTTDKLEKAGIKIVYEDDHIIILDKPSGLPSISTDKGSNEKGPDLQKKGGKAELKKHDGKAHGSVYSLLTEYLKTRAHSNRKNLGIENHDTVKAWIVHRLDRDTSGLLVFAKDERTKDIIQSKWDSLVLERKYFAICEGHIRPETGTIRNYLYEDPATFIVYSSEVETREGKLAITHYNTIAQTPRFSGVEFSLETGRKNQIRVHAADTGHPVAGDKKYGARTNPAGRLCLHAKTLVLRHPYSGRILRFDSPLPERFNDILSI
ncbi:MAG: RNA pseudouridine synthase [Bacteroidales bacterium]|nr:RNA pseudouridine synthase [Bacteroidales bacterium]